MINGKLFQISEKLEQAHHFVEEDLTTKQVEVMHKTLRRMVDSNPENY